MPKLDLTHCLAVLRACDQRPRTTKELIRAIGASRSTFFRVLDDLREQLGVEIEYLEGKWAVSDWGIIDRRRARE